MSQQLITVTTAGSLDGLEVTGANIPDDQMEFLLQTHAVVHAVNQDGVHLTLMLDMDTQSVIASAAELSN